MPGRTGAAFSGGWIRYGLAALIGVGAVCAIWLLPMLDAADQLPGPVLVKARQQQVMRIGVRSYPRPTDSTEALIAEPDEMDSELASALGRYLGIKVQLKPLPAHDLSGFLSKDEVDAVIAGSLDIPGLERQQAALSEVPQGYENGALLSLRNTMPSSLKDQSVCIANGSPWTRDLLARGARTQVYASSIRAASAFLAGDCRLLADERTVLASLLQTPDWRFYRMLPQTLAASSDASVYLSAPDPKSLRLLQAGLRDWQSRGGQTKAWDLHSNAFLVDSMKLSDGLVCH